MVWQIWEAVDGAKRVWKSRFGALLLVFKNRDLVSALVFIFNRLNLGWHLRVTRVHRKKIIAEKALFPKKLSLPIKVVVGGGGYYRRQELPNRELLAAYYRGDYWTIRGGKRNGVHERDIAHFQLLLERLPWVICPGHTALNFGAGHGGISHLFWASGMNVVNIEPSGLDNPYGERFSNLISLEDVPDASVDIIYGCHSLEHVPDIEETKVIIERKLKRPGWMFWQTPDAELLRFAQRDHFAMPTNKNYLFEASFFDSWMDNILLSEIVPDTGAKAQVNPKRRVLGSIHPLV